MKKIPQIALLAVLGLASITAAEAQNLKLGFNDAAGLSGNNQKDYVIDLGSFATIKSDAIANGGTVNLSSYFSSSLFSSAFGLDGNALNNVAAGVVGRTGSSPFTLWQTSVLGLSGAPSSAHFNNASASVGGVTFGVQLSTSQTGFTYLVAASPTAIGTDLAGNNVAAQTGNPMGQLVDGVLSIDLFSSYRVSTLPGNDPTAWVNEGTFNIDAGAGTVSFTVTPVPEPTTYSLLCGGGVLVLLMRRKLAGSKA